MFSQCSEIWPDIDAHLKKNPNSYLLPFGLKDPVFTQELFLALENHLMPFVNQIKRLWLVIGSGTLFGVLYKLLPNTYFCLVQVGKEVDLNSYDKSRYTKYVSKLKLYDEIKINIPYATTKSYDGKIWEFKSEFADGDYIWNVAGIHQKI